MPVSSNDHGAPKYKPKSTKKKKGEKRVNAMKPNKKKKG